MKRVSGNRLIILCLALMVIFTVGCGQTNSSQSAGSEASNNNERQFISIASGASGGAYYVLGAGIVKLLNQYVPDTPANSEATGGTEENLTLLRDNKVSFGIAAADSVFNAYNGQAQYEGKKQDNLRVILKGHSNALHILTLADSGINSLADLKGKRVSLNAGLPLLAEDILLTAGGLKKDVDYKSQILPHDAAATALKDGNIDAAVMLFGIPGSAVTDVYSTHKAKLISLTEQEEKKLIEAYPYMEPFTIPADTYPKQTEDVKSIGLPALLVTNKEVSDDLVYKVTKAILDHPDDFTAVHSTAKAWKLPEAAENLPIPIHPGAKKYYDEKGISVE